MAGTLLEAFKGKFDTTVKFTWSEYKKHNTAKFLLACMPNGAILFVSPLNVGSISDVELTIKYILNNLGIDLKFPPFMQGRKQLTAFEVQEGRKIAHLRIHVERVIGCMTKFKILTSKIYLSRHVLVTG